VVANRTLWSVLESKRRAERHQGRRDTFVNGTYSCFSRNHGGWSARRSNNDTLSRMASSKTVGLIDLVKQVVLLVPRYTTGHLGQNWAHVNTIWWLSSCPPILQESGWPEEGGWRSCEGIQKDRV